MFNKELYGLTLTNEIANEMFPNIVGATFNGDNSFLATLRALLAPRMKKKEHISLNVKVRNDRDSSLRDYSDEDIVRILSDGIGNNTIFVCGFNGTESSITTSFNKIESHFTQVYPKFTELEDLHVFVAKQANVRFYINEEEKSVAIFVACLNTRIWHFIQSLISRLVPWYFAENPINEEEKALVKALTNRYAPEYERIIEEFASKYDFRTAQIQKLLGGFEARAKQRQLDVVKNEIANQQSRIERLMADYQNMIENMDNLRIKESGLAYQIKEAGNDSEIVDYFVCNRHINPIYVDNQHIKIIVGTTIENYDPEMYERMTKNSRSYLFTGYNVSAEAFYEEAARKKLLDAVFGDEPLLKIKVRAYYDLDMRGRVDTIQRYDYPMEYNDYLTNPHFDFHACIGNNRPLIDQLLAKGDYIAAIEQCVSSAKNLNLSEGSQTVAPFMGRLFTSSCKAVIQLPDGTSCTPTEAYNWLLSQEQENEAQEVEK
ncbi:MAG: hypothetical protein IKI94_08940 [Ruminococcus sp.]|nr:hypothetical protein [Ruminococcus sp.]